MSFEETIRSRIDRLDSNLCVGLDPRPDRINGDVYSFLMQIVEDVQETAVALKPNIAYFEAMGPEGYSLLDRLIEGIPDSVPVILDVKRSDIPETQKYYAKAYFERWNVDAVTLNPYTGFDSLEPFLEFEDKGVYLLGITSNEGAGDLQLPSGSFPGAFRKVLEMTRQDQFDSLLGLVVGLTLLHRDFAVSLKDVPLLIPGLGAQGGDVELLGSLGGDAPVLVNSSRSIMYGSDKTSSDSIEGRSREYRDRINRALNG